MNSDPAKNPSAPPASPPAKKPRNAVELFVVRAGIVILVLLATVQAHARFGYEWSLRKLQSRLATEEETAVPLLLSDVPGMIVGFPSRTQMEDRHWHAVVYKWRGITKAYEIRMPYYSSEKNPAILALETADAPPPPSYEPKESPEGVAPPMESMAGSSGMGGGPGMGSGPGMGGRGPRPDPMANDKDGDGRLSKEEASERMAANFEQWDANSDGFVDKDEVAAARARFAQSRGGSGGPPEGEQPRGPAPESEKPTESSTKDADKPLDAAPAKENEAPADATKTVTE